MFVQIAHTKLHKACILIHEAKQIFQYLKLNAKFALRFKIIAI